MVHPTLWEDKNVQKYLESYYDGDDLAEEEMSMVAALKNSVMLPILQKTLDGLKKQFIKEREFDELCSVLEEIDPDHKYIECCFKLGHMVIRIKENNMYGSTAYAINYAINANIVDNSFVCHIDLEKNKELIPGYSDSEESE